ncbi:UNVERIFIED_CONTAM: hypothetical protein FKN15_072117 [Acipenser sinensis]
MAILRRLNIMAETHRVRFREYQRSPKTHPSVVAERLCDHIVANPGKENQPANGGGRGDGTILPCGWHRYPSLDTEPQPPHHGRRRETSRGLRGLPGLARTGILSVPDLQSSRSPPRSAAPPPPSTLGSRPPIFDSHD